MLEIIPAGTSFYRSHSEKTPYWFALEANTAHSYCSMDNCMVSEYRNKVPLTVFVISPQTSEEELRKYSAGRESKTREQRKFWITHILSSLGRTISPEDLDIVSRFPFRSSEYENDIVHVEEICSRTEVQGVVFRDNILSIHDVFEEEFSIYAKRIMRNLQAAKEGKGTWHNELALCPNQAEVMELVKTRTYTREDFEGEARLLFSEIYPFLSPEDLEGIIAVYLPSVRYHHPNPQTASRISKILHRLPEGEMKDYLQQQFAHVLDNVTFSRVPSGSPSFQLVSDLHVEKKGTFEIEKCAPVLVVAGDLAPIGHPNYREQLEYFSREWETVLVVLGNHEYFGSENPLEEWQDRYGDLLNVHLLQQNWVKMGNRYFVGCTLWSWLGNYQKEIREIMKDFREIPNFSIEAWNKAHREDLDWLQEETKKIRAEDPEAQIVVITHFPPVRRNVFSEEYQGLPTRDAFSNSLPKELFRSVDIWCFGHTHFDTIIEYPVSREHSMFIVANYCNKEYCDCIAL